MNIRNILILLLSCVACMAAAQDDTVNDFFGHKSSGTVAGVGATSQRVISYESRVDGLWLTTTGGAMRVQPLECGAVHISYGNEDAVRRYHDYVADGEKRLNKYKIKDNKSTIVVSNTIPGIIIDKASGALTFTDGKGNPILKESAGNARFNTVTDSVRPYCRFSLSPEEALYGLGQFRDGLMNLRGKKRELIQFNTQAAVPVINSTCGWGLIWTNPSRTLFSDSAEGMVFSSDYGNVVDYYVYSGKTLDELVASYRRLTGPMPMLPDWALGYHQSRNRYHNDREVLDVARRMKNEGIPMGSIFIDYHHWGKHHTGSFCFDEDAFPDVDAMLDSLHRDYNTHVVLTVWPCFHPESGNYREMNRKGFILGNAKAIDGYIYDVYNPEARKMYSELFQPMLKHEIDGWFLDGPEPDHVASFLPEMTYLGEAQRVRNIYPLLHSENFRNMLNKARPGKRHYMLTRCAWAGQQRYGTAVWSGDIPTTMDELRTQVAAGLNFTATGIPYWTTDIGGYLLGDPSDSEYRETFTRWFQYGTFCPVFRNHGRRAPGDTNAPNELWAYGDTVMNICKEYINLRYRLMPYIRSMAADVTFKGYTPMRLLAFDFPEDMQVRDCKDQFMYGPAFLVCPVLERGASNRSVYLPKGAGWHDYWTGEFHRGGVQINASAPLENIPLYVRAGSIIPNDSSGLTSIEIYPGADGEFALYEDDGLTTAYMEGDYAEIPVKWNDMQQELTLGKAKGRFNGVREFKIVLKDGRLGNKIEKKFNYNGNASKISFLK